MRSILVAIVLFAHLTQVHAQNVTQLTDLHDILDGVVSQHVSEDGGVDYASLKTDGRLSEYLRLAAQVDPALLSEQDALAHWINLYNAGTLKLIVDNYPVSSIRRITPFRLPGLSIAVPKINSPWEKKFIETSAGVVSLDHIEHAILRDQFDEPRIHFAIVCAALSCPPLRTEAYRGSQLDRQLHDQGVRFLGDRSKNQIPDGDSNIAISKIFRWFAEDFGENDVAVQTYLAPFVDKAEIKRKLRKGEYGIRYLKYNWLLNDINN